MRLGGRSLRDEQDGGKGRALGHERLRSLERDPLHEKVDEWGAIKQLGRAQLHGT